MFLITQNRQTPRLTVNIPRFTTYSSLILSRRVSGSSGSVLCSVTVCTVHSVLCCVLESQAPGCRAWQHGCTLPETPWVYCAWFLINFCLLHVCCCQIFFNVYIQLHKHIWDCEPQFKEFFFWVA